jgi:transaldolase / glucose-6-phosphate isomerase
MNTVSTLGKEAETKTAKQNPLLLLQKFGQSVWLDFIRRNLITSGELKRLIDEDGLRGITSNPSIFEKAITGSTDYADFIDQLRSQNLSAGEIFERIAVRDIQDAADLLRPVYQATNRRDGYISMEVSPTLARDTQGTIVEARRLWKAVARENLMIKVPGTPEGVPAVRQLTSEGINVNITLLFSQEAHVQVAEAFIEGLEALLTAGKDVSKMASVASFFVSRIDSLVDSKISARLKNSSSRQEAALLNSLLGKVAIANAKQAYRKYEELFSSPRWKALAAAGAQTQRLLWASTSTKNPSYSDVLYIEDLIGPDTVNTIPPATIDAFRDHGRVERTLDRDLLAADKTMNDLARAGISMQEVTEKLLGDAIQLFNEAFHQLLAAVEQKKTEPAKVKPKVQCQYCDFLAPVK